MLRAGLAAIVLMFVGGVAAAQQLHPLPQQPPSVAWPTAEWETAPLPADVDRTAFDLAVTEAFAGPHPQFG